MLTILGEAGRKGNRQCDGITRRSFMTIGGMALGGVSMAQLLAADEKAGRGRSHKAIINIFLPGGPSHIDLWDLKPDAPAEIRGELRPIKTNVPGIEICELFPRMAKMMDKFALIRSVVGSTGAHDGHQCMTGRGRREQAPMGGWPNLGAWISSLHGSARPGIPSNLSLMYNTSHSKWGKPGTGGFLGPAHGPVSLVGRNGTGPSSDLVLQGITLERLRDRRRLLSAIDTFRREADQSGVMEGLDHFGGEAINILTSSGLADALDLSKEDPAVLERYGENDPKFKLDGAPRMIRNFCVARRLVEAGARVVSLNHSRWDWHGGDGMNFPRAREDFPMLDMGLSALVTDLHERGLDKDVTVVVWGEFGRTPRINKKQSRDHWPQVSCAMLAGGGMRTGQVVGATNKFGEYAKERPVSFQEVFATLYHNVGIDVQTETVQNLQGRPLYLVDPGVEPIHELI